MSTPTATPSPSRLWLYFQETHGMVLTASEESDIRHAANAAAESDIRTLETELAAMKTRAERAEAECLEQARLLGMSGEREAALLSKLAAKKP